MSLGTINKKNKLSELFESTPGLIEVHCPADFSLEHDSEVFYLLTEYEIYTAKLLYELQKIYTLPVKLYITQNTQNAILQDGKIIWRKGTWYV